MKDALTRPFCGLLAFALCFLSAALAWAAPLRLEAPQRVARGDAFLARAFCDSPAQSVTFTWRGKTYAVPVETRDGQHCAELLLAVPVDGDIPDALTLAARLPQGPAAQSAVQVYAKERPVQKLTVEKKYVDPPAQEQERIIADRRKVQAVTARYTPQRGWTLPLQRPVPGEVSSLYGLKRVFNGQPRSVHKGLDLRGAQGEPIVAAADGVVALADNLYFSGNAVYLDHGFGVITAYLHMSETFVTPGQQVRQGHVIGRVGATGRVTGPHLHFSLLVQGVSADPLPLLEGNL